MFWTGFATGMLLGISIAIVVACMVVSARRNDAANHSDETPKHHGMLDEMEELPGELPPLAKPLTYLDRYPHS